VALLVAGCGYAVVRAAPPAGVERVAVGSFRVRAGPPVLGAWIAEEVAREIAATPGVRLASASDADATVHGEVRLASDAAVALASTGAAPRAALAHLHLEVTATLTGRDGTALARTGELDARRPREMGSADEATALRSTAAAVARRIVSALLGPLGR
jgi:hypothetical protein